jgi:hypothetical protein
LCGKLKVIKVTVKTGSGTTTHTYKTADWPRHEDGDNAESVEDVLDGFVWQHHLENIFRGKADLCSMNSYQNRTMWKLIFDEIEEESME